MYRQTLVTALRALGAGPDTLGARGRDEIAPNLRSLHVARLGRRGRHVILFRATDMGEIQVVRILHDAMDLARHVPEAPDE